MSDDQLLSALRNLEVELHRPECRSNTERLDELLHDSFFEIGRSGRRWSRSDILNELPNENMSYNIVSREFSIHVVTEKTVLLTYQSANKREPGELSRFCARTSLWQETPGGWKMRFHQGTDISEFRGNAT